MYKFILVSEHSEEYNIGYTMMMRFFKFFCEYSFSSENSRVNAVFE